MEELTIVERVRSTNNTRIGSNSSNSIATAYKNDRYRRRHHGDAVLRRVART